MVNQTEIKNDTKEEGKKRVWVKPAAITFFVIMLLLTFFSNTIMNLSLSEVSTKQVSSGAITTKVRGTGTIVSGETYDVVLSETRKVEEVLISTGDTVAAGDPLFVLDESESTEMKEAQSTLDGLRRTYQQSILSADLTDYTAEKNAITRAEKALADAKNERSAFGASTMTVSQATEALRQANIKLADITAKHTSLESRLAALAEDDSARTSLEQQIVQILSQVETADAAARSAQNTLDNETNIAAAESTIEAAGQALEDAKLALVQAVETNEKQSAVNNLDLSGQQEKIKEQEELVAELTENTVGNELTAKYSGLVTSVDITAGSSTTPNTPIAQIAVSEKGYSAEITITRQQAKEVKVGDTADVTSSANWGAEITATVESIKSSTSSAGNTEGAESTGSSGSSGTNKTVVFKLDGEDLTIGETLNLSLSQKSTNHDLLVPNSAVKTDSNGSFVLLITEKSTPLGTRYVATRADVTVAESDETSTAVVGGISAYDSVITTASKIVEPGDYVRLAEKG